MNKQILVEEQDHLDSTLKEIDNIIKSLGDELKSKTTNDVILERTNRRFINNYLDARKNPYFGRIDTYENGERETYYIGYSSIAKNKNQDIVYSWKSSIGDLYYQFHGGKGNLVVEKSEGEKYDFNVLLKRALTIERLQVKKYTDTVSELAKKELSLEEDSFLYDDFLIEVLKGRNNETKLKDIVMTIQREQNEIIRLPIENSVIVQGVAGSGKSSIALTRISYLLTRYKGTLKSEEIAIIAPNDMFLKYIQSVLPTLEIENIPQFTFKLLAINLLENLDIEYMKAPIDYFNELLDSRSTTYDKYKNSLDFKVRIDNYVKEFERHFISTLKEFKYFDSISNIEIVLSQEQILNRYNDLSYLSIVKRNKETLLFVEKWLDSLLHSKQEELKNEFNSVLSTTIKGVPKESPLREQVYNAIEKVYAYRQKILRDELNQKWKEYKKDWKSLELFSLYKRILELEMNNGNESDQIPKATLNSFKKSLTYDDIAPLIYLDTLLNGPRREFKHIVVDEAQDLSPFQINVIKKISKSVTLLGDVTQNLYLDNGISNWTKLIEDVFNKDKVRLLEINTSYRSTNPIMNGANLIAVNGNLGTPNIIPIGRSGEKISIEKIYDPMLLIKNIISSIKEIQKKGYKKIAVIHKDLNKSISLHQHLIKQFSSLQLIENSSQSVNKDVIIIPSFLTKGLEFDAVIIPNASQLNYGNNELDAKLLFVSITRAQHFVKLFYHQELSPLLDGIEMSEINQPFEGEYSFL